MNVLKRGMVVDINLDQTKEDIGGSIRHCVVVTNDTYNEHLPIVQVVPLTAWTEKNADIVTNVEIVPTEQNGLINAVIADCLQTRPIDHRLCLVGVRGSVDERILAEIDSALMTVFGLQ